MDDADARAPPPALLDAEPQPPMPALLDANMVVPAEPVAPPTPILQKAPSVESIDHMAPDTSSANNSTVGPSSLTIDTDSDDDLVPGTHSICIRFVYIYVCNYSKEGASHNIAKHKNTF